MNPKVVIPSRGVRTQKNTCCMVPSTWNSLTGEGKRRWTRSDAGCWRCRMRGPFYIFFKNFLRNLHTVLHGGRALFIPTSVSGALFSPRPHRHLLSLAFSMVAVRTGVRKRLTVVSICISLMVIDVECLFLYLSAICLSSFETCLLRFFAHFRNRLFLSTEGKSALRGDLCSPVFTVALFLN